jgi:putative hydrolase of HD superfamily
MIYNLLQTLLLSCVITNNTSKRRTLPFPQYFWLVHTPKELRRSASTVKGLLVLLETMDDVFEENEQQDDKDNHAIEFAIKYARICGKLKTTRRTGWYVAIQQPMIFLIGIYFGMTIIGLFCYCFLRVYRNIPHAESVADHSWRVAALCMLLQQESSIDIAKAMEMAILHDLAESIIGDIAPADNISKDEKKRLEHDAISCISEVLSNSSGNTSDCRLKQVIKEYEARESATAKAVKDLDLFDMLIQATEYEERYSHINLQEFFDGTPVEKFQTKSIARMAHHIHKQRQSCVKPSSAELPADTNEILKLNSPCVPLQTGDESTIRLSSDDTLFIREFVNQSSTDHQYPPGMTSQHVEYVVRALRSYERRTNESSLSS